MNRRRVVPSNTFLLPQELSRGVHRFEGGSSKRAKALTLPLLQRQNAERLKQVEAHIAAIEIPWGIGKPSL